MRPLIDKVKPAPSTTRADGAAFISVMAANSGTFWRFKAPNPGLIGPGGIRLPEQM
jgi:hypothetical protein